MVLKLFLLGYFICGIMGVTLGYAGDVKSGKDFKVSDLGPAFLITFGGPVSLLIGGANFVEKMNFKLFDRVLIKGSKK